MSGDRPLLDQEVDRPPGLVAFPVFGGAEGPPAQAWTSPGGTHAAVAPAPADGGGSAAQDRPGDGAAAPGAHASAHEANLLDAAAVAAFLAYGRERALSLAADAKHGAQVARVRLGVDATVRKVQRSRLVSRLGLPPMGAGRDDSTPVDAAGPAGAPATADSAAARGPPQESPELRMQIQRFRESPELRMQIQRFRDSHDQLQKLLTAFEDYQRHRRGLADAAQRLGLALQEAGQRSAGPAGEAYHVCGSAHRSVAERRLQADAAEELHAVSSLRAHHGEAAADCRRAVREYEQARTDLALLHQARMEAQDSKQVTGDSQLTAAVERAAAQAEAEAEARLRRAARSAQGKLAMFEAKHAVDYAKAVTLHMRSVVEEETGAAKDFSGVHTALEAILAGGAASAAAADAGLVEAAAAVAAMQ